MSTLISFVLFLNNLILLFAQEMIHGKQVIHVTGSSSSSSTVALQEMRVAITRLEREQSELKNKNKQVREVIQKVKSECDTEIEGLLKEQKAVLKAADPNMKVLNELLIRIKREEEEHVRLQGELKSYSQLFEIWKLKHDVIQGNLQLMSGRRANGTSERCRQITAEVDAQEGLTAKARSAFWKKVTIISKKRRMSSEYIQINIQQNLLNQREGEKTTLITMLEQAEKVLKEEKEVCERKRLGAQGLLKDTKTFFRTSEQSVALLQSDLSIAQTYSKEVMMQTQAVKKLIGDWSVKVQEMNRALNGYGNDRKCYAKVEKYN